VLVHPESTRLEGGAEECIAALASSPFIGIARSVAAGLADAIAAVCAEYGVSPTAGYDCNDAFSIIGLVASGLGWSIIPEFELNDVQVPGVRFVRLPHKSVIGICYSKSGISVEAGAFIDMAKEYFSRAARG
jgi:DNA-binding transcriptional LysR family regulator